MPRSPWRGPRSGAGISLCYMKRLSEMFEPLVLAAVSFPSFDSRVGAEQRHMTALATALHVAGDY